MKFRQVIVATLGFTTVCGTGVATAASLTPIVEGLSNPRGLSFDSSGTLYVSEPGIGGNGNCQPSPSTIFQPICAGNSGSYLRVTPDGQQSRLFSNFQSLAEQPSGNQGAGLQDLQFDSKGNAFVLTGFAGYPGNRDPELNALGQNFPIPDAQRNVFPPSPPDQTLNSSNLGKLFKADLETGNLTTVFDFGRNEIVNNPDGGDVVSNPYDLAIDGDSAYVVDAGGNVAYRIKLDGSEVRATAVPDNIVDASVLPPAPPGQEIPEGLVEVIPPSQPGEAPKLALQSVPTGNTVGPDGATYVGEYVGFPYPDNKARIFRIGEDGVPKVFAEGFNHITDLTFDKNGNLLVLQFSDTSQLQGDITSLPGSLIQVAPDGTRTTLVAAGEGLESASGLTVSPDGKVYITDRSVGPGLGKVVRVDGIGGSQGGSESEPVPEPITGLAASAFLAFGGGRYLKRKQRQKQAKAEA